MHSARISETEHFKAALIYTVREEEESQYCESSQELLPGPVLCAEDSSINSDT